MGLTGFAHSVIGTRECNEDTFVMDFERNLFAVADGVGGGLRGDVASKMAADGLLRYATSPETLKASFEWIQQEILQEAITSLGRALMGSTLTSLQIEGYRARVCHAGDSRCYVYRDQGFIQLTRDHRLFLKERGRFVLSSYLGIPPEVCPLRVQEAEFILKPNDRILLCSDGLYRQLPLERIAELLETYRHAPERLVETLCEEASTSEAHSDNVTVVYVDVR